MTSDGEMDKTKAVLISKGYTTVLFTTFPFEFIYKFKMLSKL